MQFGWEFFNLDWMTVFVRQAAVHKRQEVTSHYIALLNCYSHYCFDEIFKCFYYKVQHESLTDKLGCQNDANELFSIYFINDKNNDIPNHQEIESNEKTQNTPKISQQRPKRICQFFFFYKNGLAWQHYSYSCGII